MRAPSAAIGALALCAVNCAYAIDLAAPDGTRVVRVDATSAGLPVELGDTSGDGIDDLGMGGSSARFYFGSAVLPAVISSPSGSVSGADVSGELVADGRFCGFSPPAVGAVTSPGYAAATASVRTGPVPPSSDYQLRIVCGPSDALVRGMGDLNADGSTELWIGGVTSRSGIIFPGRYEGNPSNYCPSGSTSFCPNVAGGLVERNVGNFLAKPLWPVEDLNGDAVSEYAFTDRRVVFVVYGRAGFVPNVNLDLMPATAGFKVLAPVATDNEVRSVSATDLDGDGRRDLVIAYNTNANGSTNVGALLAVYGPSTGWPSTVDPDSLPASDLALIFGAQDGEEFALDAVATADANADGFGDVATIRSRSTHFILTGGSQRWQSGTTATLPPRTILVSGQTPMAPVRLRTGFDFDGDSREDVLWYFGGSSFWLTLGQRLDPLFADGFED